MFKYRYSLNEMEPWKSVNLKPRRKGKPSDIGNAKLEPVWSVKHSIKKAKLDVLVSLLPYIPPVNHGFYLDLCGTTVQSDSEEESNDEE